MFKDSVKRHSLFVLLIFLLSACSNKQENAITVKDSLKIKPKQHFRVVEKKEYAHDSIEKNCDTIAKPIRLDSLKDVILDLNGGLQDSIYYEFTLDAAFKSEGNDGIAFYKKGRLQEIILYIFTESKQCEANYTFKSAKKIMVCEKTCSFIRSIDDVYDVYGEPNTDEYCSYITIEGNCLGDISDKNSIARGVFPVLMEHIPYFLN